MKSIHCFCLSIAVGLLDSCATSGHRLVLAPVGPSASLSTSSGATGALLVFSAFDGHLSASTDDDHQHHSDYQVFAPDGRLVQTVHNSAGTRWEGPVQVDLPEGTYQVSARANGYGRVIVPVVVAAGQVTTVHLEGGDPWPDKSSFNAANSVRLPDGQIVGRRAATSQP